MAKSRKTTPADSSFGFDAFDGQSAADQFEQNLGDSSFDDSAFAPERKPVPKQSRGLSGKALLAILLCVVLAGGGIAVWFLTRPQQGADTPSAAAAAPAGPTEYAGIGRRRLLNELLVSAGESLSLKQLQETLLELEGAILGYLPELCQYQIRFNTDSRASLDEKKSRLQQTDGILRVDYNYCLSLSADNAAPESPALSAVRENAIGLMGGLPPEAESLSACFVLSSVSFADADTLRLWSGEHPDAAGNNFRADQAASLLAQSGKQAFASCFHYEINTDGTLSGYTTSFALRVQLASLVRTGAEIVAFPFLGPAAQETDLSAESEQDELLFRALEKEHPEFVLCKAWCEGDSLIQAISATETGRRHLLTVAACSGDPLQVLDAAGSGMPVFAAASPVAGADLAAPGGSVESAVIVAAAGVCTAKSTRPDAGTAAVLESCGAWAADSAGNVVPALAGTAKNDSVPVRLVTLQARDEITGEAVPDVSFRVETASASLDDTAADGELKALVPAEAINLSAYAEGYQAGSANLPADRNTAVLSLSSGRETGTVKGRILLLGSGVSGELTASFRDTHSGTQYPEQPVSENYSLQMLPGEYEITFGGYNRTPVKLYGVQVFAGQETANPDVSLSVASDLPGTAAGLVKDAMTGGPLEGAKLSFRAGAAAPEDSPEIASAVTGRDGKYSVSLTGGTYTAYVGKDGYRTLAVPIVCEAENTVDGQDCTITPEVPEGQVRIILEWGRTPFDLDSHLVNRQQNIHIFYSNKAASQGVRQIANLDVDDTSSFGPETTTILVQISGKFTFYVHDYSNRGMRISNQLAGSGARVRVCIGDQPEQVFTVPDQPGTLWEVFSIENGVLTPSGIMSYQADPGRVGQ